MRLTNKKNTNEKTTNLLNLQKKEIFQCYNSTLSLLEFGAGIQLALNVRNKMKIVENFTSTFCQEIPLIGKVSLAKITVFLFSFSFFFFLFYFFNSFLCRMQGILSFQKDAKCLLRLNHTMDNFIYRLHTSVQSLNNSLNLVKYISTAI